MSDSAIATLRERLRAERRKQNMLFGLLQFGRWLLGVTLLFVALGTLGSLFTLNGLAWKLVFGGWVLGVFALSFWCIYRFLKHLESDRKFIHSLETRLPELEQRLITSVEFENKSVPGVSRQLVQQLLDDAQHTVQSRSLPLAVNASSAYRSLGLATVALVVAGMLLFSGVFLDAARYFTWPDPQQVADLEPPPLPVEIRVEPGDVNAQRGDSVTVTASLDNASSRVLTLYTQDDNVNWRRNTMMPAEGEPETNASVFTVTLGQLAQDTVYYVEYKSVEYADAENSEAAPVKSPQYRIQLFDLPRVDNLSVAYDYPDYTGMENQTENPGGDIVAPEGTVINLAADLNKPVTEARLVFEDGEAIDLSVDERVARGRFTVTSDTYYRLELLDRNDNQNPDPVDYYVRSILDREPEISLKTPGKDQRVMPLEEVPFVIDAKDDYGLTEFEFVYSVIGVEDQTVDFLGNNNRGKIDISGETLLYLEDLEVKPGDIISYSVAAADNNSLTGPQQVVSDIYFLEVIPTDHEFSRAAGGGGAGGGGGGGGGDSTALVKTQKDVIAATWKLKNRQGQVDEDDFAADGRIIRDAQAEVAERAKMSISRLTERGTFQNDNYQNAVIALQQAIVEMEDAIDGLDELALNTALQSEQRALQEVLKAESQINRTEIALNRQRGGGGGGGGQQRDHADLRELFEMEMGELENRYEIPQQGGGQSGSQASNPVLDKLKELARRQERLTRSQRDLARREDRMTEEQKRKQLEQLKREQEELRRELSQLSQSMQQSAGGQQSSSRQQSSSQQSSSQERRDQQQRMQQLQQAMEEMEQAAESESASQAAAKSQKALDAIRQQAEAMDAASQQSVAELQDAVKQRTERLLQQQRQLREGLEALSRQQSLGDSRSESARSGETTELARQQSDIRSGMDDLNRQLREIATQAGDEDGRAMQESHDISRALRPINEKMDTSSMILQRGMVNLSLKLETDIETALSDVQRQVNNLGSATAGNGDETEELNRAVAGLRDSLERLQQQAREFNEPDSQGVRQGERSGALQQQQQQQGSLPGGNPDQVSRRDLQQTLNESRELARNLEQLGRGTGTGTWYGNARSIRSELTQQGLEEFLSRPELLQALLQPLVELENSLQVQAELSEIDSLLYSEVDENIPEEYKSQVENYYRVLSESKNSVNGP